MKTILFAILLFICVACSKSKQTEKKDYKTPVLTIEEANRLAQLPFKCISEQYPNKPGEVLTSEKDLISPQTMHPAFYGCFDWHSSVHGHWSLVALLKQYPELEMRDSLIHLLEQSITKEHIAEEVAYFQKKENKSFERTYGWAWLLKLAEELHTWDDPRARDLESNLQPLTDHLVSSYLEFLPKLNYPVRTGEHPNTAFGLTFAYDYGKTTGQDSLVQLIEKRSRDFYMDDMGCPLTWEPNGFDFLSPCLEEVDIMRRVLPKEEFLPWLYNFLPQLGSKDFTWEVGEVSDRTDGKLVHLDGLNFSRAWCLYGLANQYPEFDYLKGIANQHVEYSLPSIVDDNYEGTHWLGSFAIYALLEAENKN